MRQVAVAVLFALMSQLASAQKAQMSGAYENCKYGYSVTVPKNAGAYEERDSGLVIVLPPRPMSEEWPMKTPKIFVSASRDVAAYQKWLKNAQRGAELVPVNDPMSSVKLATVKTFLDKLPVMSSLFAMEMPGTGNDKHPPEVAPELTYAALREDAGIVYIIRVSQDVVGDESSLWPQVKTTLRALMDSFHLRPVGCQP